MKPSTKALLVGLAILLVSSLASATVVTLPITQAWQHKDTAMWCNPGGNGNIHAWDHAVNPAPGCPHCGYYCAPASISMYALYRGRVGIQTQQDDIYDQGKVLGGEIQANGTLETHGLGMWDSGQALEVQMAFGFAVGAPLQWGPVAQGMPPMTNQLVILFIDDDIPILWCDHGGYPADIYPEPSQETEEFSGHAKIIAGYDDKNTADFNDDEYYIFDPWPTSGSPYWVGSNVVLDPLDVFLADYDPVATVQSTWGAVKALFR